MGGALVSAEIRLPGDEPTFRPTPPPSSGRLSTLVLRNCRSCANATSDAAGPACAADQGPLSVGIRNWGVAVTSNTTPTLGGIAGCSTGCPGWERS